MKILFVSSEMTPLIKIGGLGDVTGSLPKALKALGHEVRVIIPQYGKLDTQRFVPQKVKTGITVSIPLENPTFNLNLTYSNEVPVYLIESPGYFGQDNIYGNYDLERFFFYSRAVIDILPELNWQPDILHCHDWLTALVAMWQKLLKYPCSTLFTIHNLAHQGVFNTNFQHFYFFKKEFGSGNSTIPAAPLSFMAQAILYSDLINTVSETYAREIMTPEYGEGLDSLIRYRKNDLSGIVNGIDYGFYDPQNDPDLPVNFDSSSPEKKLLNKIALQKVAGLPVSNEIPLVAMVQRLDEQKGIDIFAGSIDQILRENEVQFVILGTGREYYESLVSQISAKYPGKVSSFITFEEPLARLIYGGADMFLMPSHFEPCGLGQIIAMRYGSLPVVRHTGGLVDTVPEFNSDLSKGNGFVFHDYSPVALASALKKAIQVFKDKKAWNSAVRRVMNQDFSWKKSALKYEQLYKQLLAKR